VNGYGYRSRMYYDAASNLTRVVGPTSLASQFTYDGAGNLILSRDPMGYETAFGYGGPYNDLLWVRGATTSRIVDPIRLGDVAGEYSDTGDLIARYDYGFHLVSRSETTGARDYYTFDAGGSTSEWIDTSGAVLLMPARPISGSAGASLGIPGLPLVGLAHWPCGAQ
jgi:YD repeat-containing protein